MIQAASPRFKKELAMKKHASLLALAIACSTGAALAADLPLRKEAPVYIPPAPILTWAGFYGGANLGGSWGANRGNNGGVSGGVEGGYNFQFNSFVAGVEADFQGTSITSGGGYRGLYLGPVLNRISLPWFGTIRGRAGYLVTPTLLVYGTGGFAYGEVDAQSWTNVPTGWTAGGGVEWMFAPNWSAKVEYLYTDLSAGNATGGLGFNFGYHFHPQFNTVRAGVNYHFNFGQPAPVIASY
jgi:outer membrane immunogenic protein